MLPTKLQQMHENDSSHRVTHQSGKNLFEFPRPAFHILFLGANVQNDIRDNELLRCYSSRAFAFLDWQRKLSGKIVREN